MWIEKEENMDCVQEKQGNMDMSDDGVVLAGSVLG
jgi:hypothetical protein